MRPEPRRLRPLAAAVLLAAAGTAHAGMDLETIPTVDLGTWVPGNGDAVWQRDLCSASFRNNNNTAPYGLEVLTLPWQIFGGQFAVQRQGFGPRIPVTLTWTDLVTGTAEDIRPFRRTATDKTGALRNCPRGRNARFTVTARAADLGAARSGLYQSFLFLRATGGRNAGERDQQLLRMRVRIPDVIRVSGLDDIDLGRFDTVNDVSGSDRLCVFRNDTTGRYRVTVSGNGAAGAFALSSGPDSVPMRVSWTDSRGTRTVTAGQRYTMRGADTTALDCGGVGNATLGVRVQAADMQAVPNGAYSGTVTVLVAPI